MSKIDEIFEEYIEIAGEIDDIAAERKEKMEALKDAESNIKTYVEKQPEQTHTHGDFRFYIATSTTTKALNRESIELNLITYFNGNTQKAKECADFLWDGRQSSTKTSLKVSKPRKAKAVNKK